jgi:DNA-binding GntR family transcriptional regulator
MRRIKTVPNIKLEVYKIIREGIASREIPAGTQLKESDLVEKLGVSKTPIREALNQLSKEGIVEIYPRKGAFVKHWTKQEVLELFLIREVLEGLAVRLATKSLNKTSIEKLEEYFENYETKTASYAEADEQFHSDIVNGCGSKYLVTLINNLQDSVQMPELRKLSFRSPDRIRESVAEHLRIIKAMKEGNEKKAEELAREHFGHTELYYESHVD